MKKALPFVLLGGALLFLCLGIAALGVNLYLGRGSNVDLTHWQAPLAQVDARRIAPADALVTLAGVPDTQAIDNALAQGDWEAALALVAYTPDLSDANRAGTLLLLGSRYALDKQAAKAAWCYQYASTLAVISPTPSDLTRTQTLLEASQGLRGLGLASSARAQLDQAYLIAQYSFTLQRDPRARLLSQIGQAYQDLGQPALAAQARQKSQEAASLVEEDAAGSSLAQLHLPLTALPSDDQLTAMIGARTTAAKELIDELNLHPPKAGQGLPADLVRTLGDKLYAEDGERMYYYDTQYKAAADLPGQAAVLRDKTRWLALKLRVARGDFGLSLVPDWEAQAKTIAGQLNETENLLYQTFEQEAGSAKQAADSDYQLEGVLRSEIVAGRWGLMDYNESDLRSRLDEVTQRLRDEQVAGLRLDAFQRANELYYLLLPDELYGQGQNALPR